MAAGNADRVVVRELVEVLETLAKNAVTTASGASMAPQDAALEQALSGEWWDLPAAPRHLIVTHFKPSFLDLNGIPATTSAT